MEKWKKIKLEKILSLKNGKEIKKQNRTNGNIKIYGSTGVLGFSNQHLVDEPCIIIARVGENCGKIQKIDEKAWITDNAMYSTLNNKEVDFIFIYYILKLMNLNKYSKGSVQPLLTKSILENLEIPLPPLETQNKIAKILSTIDQKIEINNEINEKLEEMTKLLYNEWFVEFNFPNEEGKTYRLSGGEMVESELGMIPKGWEVDLLKNHYDFKKGFEYGSANYLKEKTSNSSRFIRVGDMLEEKGNVFISNEILKENLCNENEILISMDGSCGRIAFGLNGYYSTGIRKLVSKNIDLDSNMFVFSLLNSSRIQETIERYSTGSILKHASQSINYINFSKPPKEVFKAYKTKTDYIWDNMVVIKKENQKLKETRDLLLYQLMNNEIDLSKMEI